MLLHAAPLGFSFIMENPPVMYRRLKKMCKEHRDSTLEKEEQIRGIKKKLCRLDSQGDLRALESDSGRDFQSSVTSSVQCTGEVAVGRRNS